jgi:hypothetical protein
MDRASWMAAFVLVWAIGAAIDPLLRDTVRLDAQELDDLVRLVLESCP